MNDLIQSPSFNKLDAIIIIIAVIQLVAGFAQGYKKAIYHSVRYILAYGITRMIYKLWMPSLVLSSWYSNYRVWLGGKLKGVLPINADILNHYPVDKYVFNIIIYVVVLILLRVIIVGWFGEVETFDRVAGAFVGIVKTMIIVTVIVILINPFVTMLEPITGKNVIKDSKMVGYMKTINPLLNGVKIEF